MLRSAPLAIRLARASLVAFAALSAHAVSAHARPAQWAAFAVPTEQRSEAVGGYAQGCLLGGVAAPEKGTGFETIRRSRGHYFGHAATVEFVERYGKAMAAVGQLPVLIGDLSQPRGGPMPTGHRSHQSGLDVDVWFSRPAPDNRRKDKGFPSLVDERRERVVASVFRPEHAQMLKLAAEDPAVARVFVGWVIKRELCATVEGDRAWLRKIRPWFGHTRHFHVRLECPSGSAGCQTQMPMPEGDGCGQETWFSRAEVLARRAEPPTPRGRPPKRHPMPSRCATLLAAGRGGGKGSATASAKGGAKGGAKASAKGGGGKAGKPARASKSRRGEGAR